MRNIGLYLIFLLSQGHYILGHGQSSATGYGKEYQNEEAIRTENLILRVMFYSVC